MNGLIGNTPMIKIKYQYQNKQYEVYTKLEYYNLTGSIKDRMADYILKQAYKKGILKEGMPIIEATSGNTGISFSSLGCIYHNPVYIFMPDWCSIERKKLMESFGATVFLVSKEEGGFQECIKRADELSLKLNGFRPNQFSNPDNKKAHITSTALEIIKSVPDVSAFVSGIGTGGTLMGIGTALKEKNPLMKIIALEPTQMALLSGSTMLQNHQIEGIGDDFIPELVEKNSLDEVLTIDDKDAVNMARCLGKKLGLGVGISSGANFLAACLYQINHECKIVTVFPDDNKKYLSTKLLEESFSSEPLFSNEIQLLDYEIVS